MSKKITVTYGGKRELIGHVGVDSGSIVLCDPCYIVEQDISWMGDFHATMFDNPDDRNGHEYTEPLGETMGLHIQTAYGDGVYPVYAQRLSDGRIGSVTILFDTEQTS